MKARICDRCGDVVDAKSGKTLYHIGDKRSEEMFENGFPLESCVSDIDLCKTCYDLFIDEFMEY